MCVQIWLRKSVIIIENQRLGRSALIVDATQAVVNTTWLFFLRFPQRSNWQKVSLFINFIFNGDVYIDGHHREPVQMQMVPLFYSHNFRININVVMISYVKKTSLFPVLTTITNFLFHRSPCECVGMTPV